MPMGRTLINTHLIAPTRVSADGAPKYKSIGIKINLGTLAAAPVADVNLPDGSIIRANQGRYLRYGQILTKMNQAEVQTVALANATGGTFTLTLPASGVDAAQTTVALAFNATAAQVKAAMDALPRISAYGSTTVTLAATTYTITFPTGMGNVPQLTSTNNLTGAGPTITHATTTQGLATNGEFGPYDPGATDGRQTLTRGECYVLDETWLETPAGGTFPGLGSVELTGGVIEAGEMWQDRLIITAGAASLAAGPTIANFLAAFPAAFLVKQ